MPLDVRSIAIKISVLFFFILGFAGLTSGLAPFTCCKRGLAGAVAAYIATVIAVKVINVILIQAMIENKINERKEKADGAKG
jgi:hypothetical protein